MHKAEDLEKLFAGVDDRKLEQLAQLPQIRARIGAKCHLTERQIEAQSLLRSAATHIMLFGGSRSGKTFLIVRDIVSRALESVSRHAILRFRFSHVRDSVAMDTLPKVMETCYPKAEYRIDKSLWVAFLENGSEIWFGGLDEKERTEKILGNEYASMFLNECSQIKFQTRQTAVTRLAQETKLALKMYYDCNPPSRRHWTHLMFVDKIDPSRHQPLVNPNNYTCLQMNPSHNAENLPAGYIQELENLDERTRKRFLLGVFSDDDDTALWTPEMLDNGRVLGNEDNDEDKVQLPDMLRVIVGVDPSGCSGPEDLRSDEVGIVVAGLGVDGRGYVLEDLSGRFGPDKWKTIVASAYERYKADAVVAEVNYGGAMVQEIMRTASTNGGVPIAFREVRASRGKVVRAEPIAVLFAQNKVSLVGRFEDLEYQLCAMTTGGYMGDRSPDRADAMIWALTALFPAMAREARGQSRQRPKVVLGYQSSKRRR